MSQRYPCGGISRRQFLAVTASALPLATSGLRYVSAQEPKAARSAKALELQGKLGVPGPWPGRVVECRHPGIVKADRVRDRDAMRLAMNRGLTELTGADDGVEAWRTFFEPGDVVGIKVVPNGVPNAPTSIELILNVIEALESAGVKKRDIIVYDRYKEEFMGAGYQNHLPEGILWGGLTPGSDNPEPAQLRMKWPGGDPVSGYDPDEFVEMNLVHRGHDPKDDRNLRSHLGLLVTRRVNKIIGLPVLKDHGSAGVTGALKNMSHGSVNNVARSHSTPDTNSCNMFIPEVVSHPIIRKKFVLQIMDGSVGIYQGGPFGRAGDKHWTWENNALYVATDPVALDHVEWKTIDAKRKEMGLASVGSVGKLGQDSEREGFDMRQPQHIALAGNLGLGNFDFKSPMGRRFSIDHRVIQAI